MITTTALTKSYDTTPAVRDVSLHCEPGTITGFLGANGAGKSTTLKMIVGLVRPDRGTATIDGRPFVELPNPTRVVGLLLDASAMHPGRSGRATLTIAARMAGVQPKRVEHLLDLVGLADAADKLRRVFANRQCATDGALVRAERLRKDYSAEAITGQLLGALA